MVKKLLFSLFTVSLFSGAYAQVNITAGKLSYYDVTGSAIDEAEFNTNCEGDAYDGVFQLYYDGYSSSGTYYSSANDITTTNSVAGEVKATTNGLQFSRTFYFDATNQSVRNLVKITNPTASNVSAFKFSIYHNFGSDGSTTIQKTSSGGSLNAIPVNTDSWFITSDNSSNPLTNCADPIITSVRYMPGASVIPKLVTIPGQNGGGGFMEDSVVISVPAGATRYYMSFHRLDSTFAAANTNSSKFASVASMNAAGLFTGIPTSDYNKFVNFDLTGLLTSVAHVTDVSESISLYPNPVSGMSSVNVKLDNTTMDAVNIRLLDTKGMLVKTMNVAKNSLSEEFSIALEGLNAGIYTLQIVQGSNIGHKLVTVY